MADAVPIMLPAGHKGLSRRVGAFEARERSKGPKSNGVPISVTAALSNPPQSAFLQHTALSNAFTTFLPILSDYVRAEQRLEQIDANSAPKYAPAIAAAERAQDCLIDALHALRSLPLETHADVPLRRMALLVNVIRGSDGPEARRLHGLMQDHFTGIFCMTRRSPLGLHRCGLLAAARPIIAELVALTLFDSLTLDAPEPYSVENFHDQIALGIFGRAGAGGGLGVQSPCP
jgi:hypothetical protein